MDLLLLLAYAELVEPSDGILICRVKHLKPTREFCQWTFVDNIRHCLLAATGTEWVISYAPYMQRSSTDTVTSKISVEYSPVASLEIEPWLARGWISYYELVAYFLFSPIFLPSLMHGPDRAGH